MKKVCIVGFGRFGKILHKLIDKEFAVSIYDIKKVLKPDKSIKIVRRIPYIYKSEIIFYCVPISEFKKVISTHKKYFSNKHILIDTLSVKLHPKKVFEKHLRDTETQAILTHPMFGPDSTKDGFTDLPIVIDKFKARTKTYVFLTNYFKSKGLKVIEMSARKHDKLAANSQGITHFIGRLLDEYTFTNTPIDTLGAKKLHQVKDQTCNDTWQLFYDLQHFNPYTQNMRIKLGKIYDKLYNRLLPKQVNLSHVTYGIQGGKGSFNEEAILYLLKREGKKRYKIKYLFTTENVLKALNKGEVDIGQFAIHNSIGGIVQESITALAGYKVKIIKEFAIKISHTLMIRRDAMLSDIDTIMTHPQVLAQCKKTLSKKYPKLKKISGKGKMIDHAFIAKKLSEKKLAKNIATIGSKVLAEIYNLKIIEDNLQDAKDNYTAFMHITR
jgi:arogenate dehydrogenase (NADP+)